jgi:C_GCAxxG_C_C family probable redox protein
VKCGQARRQIKAEATKYGREKGVGHVTAMDNTDPIDDLLARAHEIRGKGFNCAETVLWELGEYWNMGVQVSYGTGLGGGVARLGETCGALTGAILALGARVGRTDPGDNEKKVLCYRLGQGVAREFREAMGTTQCKDIIGLVPAGEGIQARWTQAYRTGGCGKAIEVAIRAGIRAAGE